MAAAIPWLTSPAHAWWRGGWGWRGAGLGLAAAAVVGSAIATVIRLTAMVMGPVITAVTDTPTARSMPPLWAFGITGADKEPTRAWSFF
jgi:hypothetical protein